MCARSVLFPTRVVESDREASSRFAMKCCDSQRTDIGHIARSKCKPYFDRTDDDNSSSATKSGKGSATCTHSRRAGIDLRIFLKLLRNRSGDEFVSHHLIERFQR